MSVGEYVAKSPDGAEVKIPRELFLALNEFTSGEKPQGYIEIHFRQGGVDGIKSIKETRYK